jgi:hypothetical protein
VVHFRISEPVEPDAPVMPKQVYAAGYSLVSPAASIRAGALPAAASLAAKPRIS